MPADKGWSRGFDEPIALPNGKKLLTLKDAIAWLAKGPEGRARHEAGSSRRALRNSSCGEQRPDDLRLDGHDAGDQSASRQGV
jgi:hypothetical protein